MMACMLDHMSFRWQTRLQQHTLTLIWRCSAAVRCSMALMAWLDCCALLPWASRRSCSSDTCLRAVSLSLEARLALDSHVCKTVHCGNLSYPWMCSSPGDAINMIAIIGTSDRLCWLAETCKIILRMCHGLSWSVSIMTN